MGVLVAPLARDPWVGWVYAGLGVLAGATGVVFWRAFGGEKEGGGKEVEEFELAGRGSFGSEEEAGSKVV